MRNHEGRARQRRAEGGAAESLGRLLWRAAAGMLGGGLLASLSEPLCFIVDACPDATCAEIEPSR